MGIEKSSGKSKKSTREFSLSPRRAEFKLLERNVTEKKNENVRKI
jgi:hypothetical protein